MTHEREREREWERKREGENERGRKGGREQERGEKGNNCLVKELLTFGFFHNYLFLLFKIFNHLSIQTFKPQCGQHRLSVELLFRVWIPKGWPKHCTVIREHPFCMIFEFNSLNNGDSSCWWSWDRYYIKLYLILSCLSDLSLDLSTCI